MMTTGKEAYQNYMTYYNRNFSPPIDPVSNPDLISNDATHSILAAMFEFKIRVINKLGTINANTSVKDVSRIVNGGYLGLQTRITYTNSAMNYIKCN